MPWHAGGPDRLSYSELRAYNNRLAQVLAAETQPKSTIW